MGLGPRPIFVWMMYLTLPAKALSACVEVDASVETSIEKATHRAYVRCMGVQADTSDDGLQVLN